MDAYRRAGVDLDAASEAVTLIRDLAAGASRPEVAAGVGGFAGLFRLGDGRVLAAAADGVGTKVEIARQAERLDTVGIDLVAMCANDVVCTGAEPLFFLDYIVAERLVPADVAALVSGVAEGCRRAGCALLGGETAEHPGHLAGGRFDLAGFCVGIADQESLLGAHRVHPGDAVVGLASSGLHANGFSLVRRAIEDAGLDLGAIPDGLDRPLGEELLEPTLIYAPAVAAA
jgi:phosphoribosylformylglycinamidine cyclo-ligase